MGLKPQEFSFEVQLSHENVDLICQAKLGTNMTINLKQRRVGHAHRAFEVSENISVLQ
jgi:hypothetical protein